MRQDDITLPAGIAVMQARMRRNGCIVDATEQCSRLLRYVARFTVFHPFATDWPWFAPPSPFRMGWLSGKYRRPDPY